MTKLLKRYFSRRGRTVGLALPSDEWRRVPKINLLLIGRSRPASRTTVAALLAILLVEAIFLWTIYGDVTAARDDSEEQRRELILVQRTEDRLAAKVQTLYQAIDQLQPAEQERSVFEISYTELVKDRVEWGAYMLALFGTEVPGIQFQSVSTEPTSGNAEVFGVATSAAAMRSFQSEIANASDILDLISLRWAEGDASLDFSASFNMVGTSSDE